MPTHLLSEIAEAFQTQGYYIARSLLSPAEVEEIKSNFMDVTRDGTVEGISEPLKFPQPNDPLARYPRMHQPHIHPELPIGPIAERYLLDPRIEHILRECMQEQPIAVQSMFYFKPPGARGQSLHQDNYYLRVKPKTCCAAWIAIDPADAENGGMMVVPGSQNMEIVCPETADTATSFTSDHVPVPQGMSTTMTDLQPGDVLFFNGSLIHGSTPNSSKTRFRRSLICHYVPESTTEMSHWYHRAIRTFDRSKREIATSTDGGPCGTLVFAPH